MPSKVLTRRQALQGLIAAGGGITAAAFLPSQWTRPVISTGVLPVHAQTSTLYLNAYRPSANREGTSLTLSDITVFVSATPVEDLGAHVYKLAAPAGKPTGGVPNVVVTMTYQNRAGAETLVSAPNPSLPRTATTDQHGSAYFSDQEFSLSASDWLFDFDLIFTAGSFSDSVRIQVS